MKDKTNRVLYAVTEKNPLYKWWNFQPRWLIVYYTLKVNDKGEMILGEKLENETKEYEKN